MSIELPEGYFFRVHDTDDDGDVLVQIRKRGKYFGSACVRRVYVNKRDLTSPLSGTPQYQVEVAMRHLEREFAEYRRQRESIGSLAGDYPPKKLPS